MPLTPDSFSTANTIVCFIGIIIIYAFVQRFAGVLFQKFFPKTDKDVTNKDIKELKKEIAVLRELLLVVAVKTGVPIEELKSLVWRQ
jgi:hypothetical protein